MTKFSPEDLKRRSEAMRARNLARYQDPEERKKTGEILTYYRIKNGVDKKRWESLPQETKEKVALALKNGRERYLKSKKQAKSID